MSLITYCFCLMIQVYIIYLAKLSTQDENFGQNVHGQSVLAKLSGHRLPHTQAWLATASEHNIHLTKNAWGLVSYSCSSSPLVGRDMGNERWQIMDGQEEGFLTTACRWHRPLGGEASTQVSRWIMDRCHPDAGLMGILTIWFESVIAEPAVWARPLSGTRVDTSKQSGSNGFWPGNW